MSLFSDVDWLPSGIGLGVGLGEGVLAVSGAEAQSSLIAPIYRLGIFGIGLVRELRATPGQNPIAVDINYSLMSAALALEANLIPGAVTGGGFRALGKVTASPMHAHGKSCSTCASRKPVVAAPLLTPAASLRGYHEAH